MATPRNNRGRFTKRATRKPRAQTRKASSEHKMRIGTRAQVMHGTAHHTSGGLVQGDLMKHNGRIVSRKAHEAGKKAMSRLRKSGKMAPPFTGK